MYAVHNTEDHAVRVFEDDGDQIASFDDGYGQEGTHRAMANHGFTVTGTEDEPFWAKIKEGVWVTSVTLNNDGKKSARDEAVRTLRALAPQLGAAIQAVLDAEEGDQ